MADQMQHGRSKASESTDLLSDLDSTPRTDEIARRYRYDTDRRGQFVLGPADLFDHARQLERELNVSRSVNLDDRHTDTLCRESARPVLGDWVDGDSWGVPSAADIVDRLVNMVILSDNAELRDRSGSATPPHNQPS